MFVSSIQSTNYNKKTAFKGLSPEVLKNQMRIYLCQDIFAEKLKVKLPETALEKEVLLEVLKNRLQLDKLTRLANEKLRLKTKLNEAVSLLENDKKNPRLEELKTELAKKGNLEAVVDTMTKTIEKEKKIKKSAVDYFSNVSSLEDEYYKKNFISAAKVDRFIKSVKTNNINKNGEYSTQDLIDIIEKQAFQEKAEQKSNIKKPKISINKNRFIEILTSNYEDFMRTHVNIYRGKDGSISTKKYLANNYFVEKFSDYFNKFPEVKSHLDKICTSIRLRYLKNIHRFEDINIYNLERILLEMDKVLAKAKTLQAEVNELEAKINETANDELKKQLLDKRVELTKSKVLWQEYLDTTMCGEQENRNRLRKAGFEQEYDYLVEKSSEINRFKELHKILKDNNDMLPDNVWTELLEQIK